MFVLNEETYLNVVEVRSNGRRNKIDEHQSWCVSIDVFFSSIDSKTTLIKFFYVPIFEFKFQITFSTKKLRNININYEIGSVQ